MKHLAVGTLHYEFSRHLETRLRIESGETLTVDTEDAFSGQIRTDDDRRDKTAIPYSNPQTGPIWIEGSQPGDSLAVSIHSIEPTIGQCATRTSDPNQLAQWLGTDCPHGTHVCPIRGGLIHWSDEIQIPYQPMLGCIGTAPAMGASNSMYAGPHGGNLDLVEVCPGSIVYLPVLVAGGLLMMGDAHAAMGHGELSASGLEMPARSTITVELLKARPLSNVRIESADELVAVATGCPMERSIAQAYAELIRWMHDDYQWDRWRAYDLLTHVGRISVGYYAFGTVGAKVMKRYLNGC